MAMNIFSTYRAGENRVTSSLLAVLRSLSIDRMQRIVGAMLGEASTELVSFNNQVAKSEPVEDEHGNVKRRQFNSIPDGEIRASFRLLIETKTERDKVRLDQLRDHLERLNKRDESHKLIVLTPDTTTPEEVVDLTRPGEAGEGRVIWLSFADLSAALDEMLDDADEVIGEREAFLVRELQAMFEADKLLEEPEDVAVVAASRAWSFYLEHGVYTCPVRYPFRPVTHIAFYAKGAIQPQVAKIISPPKPEAYDNVLISEAVTDDSDPWLRDKLAEIQAAKPEWFGESTTTHLFRLSPPPGTGGEHAGETVKLERPIKNDSKNKKGGNTAFTMGKRYVRLDRLRDENAQVTSDVVGKGTD